MHEWLHCRPAYYNRTRGYSFSSRLNRKDLTVAELKTKNQCMNTCITVLLVLQTCQVFSQSHIKTTLKQGPHQVGFKAGVHYDLGRPPIKGQFSAFQQGRAVHVSVWYPATTKANHPPMVFSEYVDEISRMLNPREVTKRTRMESIHQMNLVLSQLGGNSALVDKHLAALLNSSTNAFRNASTQAGSFPVVVYPESPYLNSMLCEYLASYGYIVVSVSRHGTLTTDAEWQAVRGIETLIQDCQFALSVLKKEFKSAGPGLAVMGTGMNASAGLGWMMRNPSIDGLVSLDGGILTGYADSLVQKSPYFDVTQVNKPMLVMHTQREPVETKAVDQYTYADRFILRLPYMRDFPCTNVAVWEKTFPGMLVPSSGDTGQGFEWMARYVLYFLDWQLKMGIHGKSFFDETPEAHGVPTGMMELSVIRGVEK
jgi:hypothetical protein